MTLKFKTHAFRFLIIIGVLFPVAAKAQLSAPGARTVRYTSYPSAPALKHPVFIFCNSTGTQKGSLKADSPGGVGPFNFTWYKWNSITNSFSDLIRTETGVMTSTLINLDEGGYRVDISGGFTASLIGWIHLDKPFASARLLNRTCDYVALNGKAVADTFYYSDPMSGVPVKLPNGVKFMWSSNPQSSIPYPDFLLNPQTFDPPLVDVVYRIQVTDSFGCVNESSFNYQSIHVKAEFTADPVKGDAPLDVAFTDKSIRGTYKYRWNFGEKDKNGKKMPDWVVNKDSLWIFSSPLYHKYYRPGEYTVTLTVESDLHCIDSFKLADKIVVDPSKIDIPNVFTPDGDGYNDRFAVDIKSLQWIDVEIFSRSGLRVYNFHGEGDILDAWQGWDGNVNETSIKASPGVYFYIIKARGWDDVKYDSREQRGFVYLYR
jgi:gliding motility-associated-like protein